MALQARNVSKSFAGVKALDDVSLFVQPGRVHALVGENGAGKSTLLKILAGLLPPGSGDVVPRGGSGVAMVHQELMAFPELSVAENICMGRQPVHRFPGWVDRGAQRSQAMRVLGLLGVRLDPDRIVRTIGVAEMQLVEIARALVRNPDVLLMDEPTSALSGQECDSLMRIIRALAAAGTAVVYTSHKLDEIFRVSDDITVLRDGRRVVTCTIAEVDEQRLIGWMVGRDLEARVSESSVKPGEVVLEVSGLRRRGADAAVSFVLRRGEILGIAGLMGAGRTELASVIFGLIPPEQGEIRMNGRPVRIASPADAIHSGIAMVSEDRKLSGIVPGMSVQNNMTLASLRRFCRGPWIASRAESQAVSGQMRSLAIKTRGPGQPVDSLSGGNQQKVMIARALLTEPEVLILDEPARGIDIGAKAEVHHLIRQLARSGKAVLLISSELPELLSLSDRILVMRGGGISAELVPNRTTESEILRFAMPAGNAA